VAAPDASKTPEDTIRLDLRARNRLRHEVVNLDVIGTLRSTILIESIG